MRFHLPLVALFAALVAAEDPDLSGLPACSAECFISNLDKAKKCGSSDFNCLCHSTKYLLGVQKCAQLPCNKQEQDVSLAWAKATCKQYGVNLVDEGALEAEENA